MAGQNVVTFQGTLLAGPPRSSSSTFPSALVNKGFALTPTSKVAAVMMNDVRALTSPSGFVTLHGVGPGESVTQGNFLALQTDNPIDIRISTDDGAGGTVVAVVTCQGMLVIEKPANKFIKLLEAQGVGTVEYFVSGNI